jgi:hypothetical protein
MAQPSSSNQRDREAGGGNRPPPGQFNAIRFTKPLHADLFNTTAEQARARGRPAQPID